MWAQIWLALVSACAGAAGEPKYGRSTKASLPSCCAFSYCSRKSGISHSMEAKRSIIDYLADHARRSPDTPVVHYKERTVSFRELEERSARARGALTALGIKHGDRVALVMS